jgi:molecular chaperone DnaK (HSP70)
MKFSTKILACVCLTAGVAMAPRMAAQNSPAPTSKPQTSPAASDVQTRITIEVTGGEKNIPVENASVYVKFVEEHAIKKDMKLEMNVKTSRDGIAHVPNAPMGRVLVQVVAEGWKTYGHWLDITDPKQTIKVHLEKPPKWY